MCAHFVWLNVALSACVYICWACLYLAAPVQAEQTHLNTFSLVITIFHQALFIFFFKSKEMCDEEIPASNIISLDIWLKVAWKPLKDPDCQRALLEWFIHIQVWFRACQNVFIFGMKSEMTLGTEIIGCVWGTCISWSTKCQRIQRRQNDVVNSTCGECCLTWKQNVLSNNLGKCHPYWMYNEACLND